jgi:hypothetical protein
MSLRMETFCEILQKGESFNANVSYVRHTSDNSDCQDTYGNFVFEMFPYVDITSILVYVEALKIV